MHRCRLKRTIRCGAVQVRGGAFYTQGSAYDEEKEGETARVSIEAGRSLDAAGRLLQACFRICSRSTLMFPSIAQGSAELATIAELKVTRESILCAFVDEKTIASSGSSDRRK